MLGKGPLQRPLRGADATRHVGEPQVDRILTADDGQRLRVNLPARLLSGGSPPAVEYQLSRGHLLGRQDRAAESYVDSASCTVTTEASSMLLGTRTTPSSVRSTVAAVSIDSIRPRTSPKLITWPVLYAVLR
jgi:hypothetical protein